MAGRRPTRAPIERVRDARPDELAAWDARAVDAPGGHVYQSRAWADHRQNTGWRPTFLVADDGGPILALSRRWLAIPGGSAYIPRGPAGAGAVDGRTLAARQVAAAEALAGRGTDVIAADPEVPASDTAFRDAIVAAGFRPIDEIQPSRHRVSLPLERGADEPGVFENIAKSTRQRIRGAERDGLRVIRYDARWGETVSGEGFEHPTTGTAEALDRFYDLLLETGERRHFRFGPRGPFLAWWTAATPRPGPARSVPPGSRADRGPVLYRTAGDSRPCTRATTATRRTHPGRSTCCAGGHPAAIREGCREMDLGGVDAPATQRAARGRCAPRAVPAQARLRRLVAGATGAHERVYDARGTSWAASPTASAG